MFPFTQHFCVSSDQVKVGLWSKIFRNNQHVICIFHHSDGSASVHSIWREIAQLQFFEGLKYWVDSHF